MDGGVPGAGGALGLWELSTDNGDVLAGNLWEDFLSPVADSLIGLDRGVPNLKAFFLLLNGDS